MLSVIVRSRKDAAALSAMVERFYPDWDIEILTLRGARTAEKAWDTIQELGGSSGRSRFYLVMLGREDYELARELQGLLPPNFAVHIVPRAKVRNARLEMLASEFAKAKTRFRISLSWDEELSVYRLGGGRLKGLPEEPQPSFEAYIGLGVFNKLLERLYGVKVGSNPLVVRTTGDEHLVFNGGEPVLILQVKDYGLKPPAKILSRGEPIDVDINRAVRVNMDVLRLFEEITVNYLRSLGSYDSIIVPWSGGKDSTAALLLAVKAFGVKRVIAVFGDTGTEFPQTVKYVEEVASKLGVRVERVYAGVDAELAKGKPLPTHENRWCTELKIKAVEAKTAELAQGRTLIVVGDRDAESPRRSMRPTLRKARYVEGIDVVAPLRLWGGIHVQLYVLYNNIPLNPLYYQGFYRIGCYMCPSLRSLEIAALTNSNNYLKLLRYKIYRKFIFARLFRRPEM